jgi:flagellum-specific ATP synthase
MQMRLFEDLTNKISGLDPVHQLGRVIASDGTRILVSGLTRVAKLGDLIHTKLPNGQNLSGEVIQIDTAHITVMPDGALSGLQLGAQARLMPPLSIRPCDEWLGRVIDANGNALDDRRLPQGSQSIELRNAPPQANTRRGFGSRMSTGSYAMNTCLPLVRGQRMGLFAGSGVGKSTLLGTLVKHVECEVVVVALVGERGRELRHFTQEILGEAGMRKCVVVAATSDRPALERRRCSWTAMSVAEYFRDQGKSVLFIADSVTRFAEAHREVATASGEVPVLRGHPPSTAHLITELCERAGPGEQGSGDITAVLSVLVQGSDMEEPIADILRGVLDGHIVLDRAIAERGRYPAISLLQSVSRSLPNAASSDENRTISRVRELTSIFEQNSMMVRSGLYTKGADPELDVAVQLWPEIDNFLGQCGQNSPEQCFDKLKLMLRRAGAI